MSETTATRPRQGDIILDPSGGRNRIIDVRNSKLLLEDSTGFQFVLAKHRLEKDWQHQPTERKPRRDRNTARHHRTARIPYLPRLTTERLAA